MLPGALRPAEEAAGVAAGVVSAVEPRTLAANSFWSLASQILYRGSLILAAIILARSLPTSAFAAFSYFQMTAAMLATYAALGLGTTASRYFAEAGYERGRQVPLGTLMALTVTVSAASFALVMLIPSAVLSGGLGVPRWLLALGVASIALGVIPGGAVLGVERFRDNALISLGVAAIMLVAVVWAAAVHSAVIAMVAVVVAMFLQAAAQVWVVARVLGWPRLLHGFGLARDNVRHVYTFAGPMMLVSLMAGSGTWVVGRMILQSTGTPREFALYTIGMQWFSLALLLPNVIARVVLPRMVRLATGAAHSKELVRRSVAISTSTGLVIAVAAVALGPVLLLMYGSHYDAGRWFMAAYMFAGLLNAPISPMGNAVLANDGQRTWAVVTGVWFVVLLLVAGLAVVAGLGRWTGAVAQSAGNGVQLIITALVCRRRALI